MGRGENAERVRRYFETWKREGLEAFLAMLPPDVWAERPSNGGAMDADVHEIEPIDENNVLVTGIVHRRMGDETASREVAWLYSFRDGRLWRASGHSSAAEAREAARFLHTDRVALGRTGPHFHVTLHEEPGGRTVLEVVGELDVGTADQLTAAIARAASSGHVLVDMSGLEFMDSSGLRALLEATRNARDDGWRLELRRGSAIVQRVIAMAGAERLLPFEPD